MSNFEQHATAPTLIPGVVSTEPATDTYNQVLAAAKRLDIITKAVMGIACDKNGKIVRPVKIKMHHGAVLEAGCENAIRAIEQGAANLVAGQKVTFDGTGK